MRNAINNNATFNETMNFSQVAEFLTEKGLFTNTVDLMFDIIKTEGEITAIDSQVLRTRLNSSNNETYKNIFDEMACELTTYVKQF